MRNKGKCSVEGCTQPQHAKTLCGRHYGQMWRGRPITTDKERIEEDPNACCKDVGNELAHAERMYELVSGFEGRVRWRGRVSKLREELKQQEKEQQPAMA